MSSDYPIISRENNFDVVRLFAALQVCTGHIFLFFNLTEQSGWFSKIMMYFPGVIIFFAISGFLVTASWCRSRSVKHYVRNRFVRIFPALFVCFVVLQLVLVIFGHIGWSSLGDGQMWMYWLGQLSLGQFFTPDSLRGFGVGVPNTSLWTIPVEIEFYILLPLLFVLMAKVKVRTKLLIIAAVSIIVNILLVHSGFTANVSTNATDLMNKMGSGNYELIFRLIKVTVAPYLYCFLLGSLLYLHWDRVKRFFVNKALYWLAIYAAVILLFDNGPGYEISSWGSIISNLLLGCIAISAAFSFGRLYRILYGFDISYGIYIIHMIVVNIFLELGYGCTLLHAAAALTITIILSLLLYKYVERPSLRLKR